jgi:nucleotide-binding universal stress UspA family protein
MVLKSENTDPIKNCFLPTAGGPNALLASDILNLLATHQKMTVTAGYIVSEGAAEEERVQGYQKIEETLKAMDNRLVKNKRLIESQSIAGGIAKASRDFDLVVIGAAKEPFFRKMLFGEIPEKVARYSPCSVLVVKKYEGVVKNLLKKILG